MDVSYLVEAKQQVSQFTCIPTAIWMLHKWRLDRMGMHTATPLFDAIVNVSEKQYKQQGSPLGLGVSTAQLGNAVRNLGLESKLVDVDPRTFQKKLKEVGPFVYIDSVPAGNLPTDLLLQSILNGAKFYHAVLITGIRDQHSTFTILFNDPGTGARRSLEFYDFVTRKYKPYPDLSKALIIYMN